MLGLRLLIENPASYLRYRHSPIPEPEFITEVSRRTGCGILCDVNNLYVSARNFGFDPIAYLDALPVAAIWPAWAAYCWGGATLSPLT